MVKNHFRWDFIGLSTDTKPTPENSEKVTDGSTYYTSDDSKLYVWYKDQWYEKEVTGGGGGGSYTAGDGIVIDNNEISVNLAQTTGTSTTSVMSQKAVTDALASAGGPTVVQTVGASTTNVMSQNATSTLIFPNPENKEIIGIGVGTSIRTQATAVGGYAQAGNQGVSIGYMSGKGTGTQNYITNIGCSSGKNPSLGQKGSVSLGAYSKATMTGEVNVGSTDTSCGYNGTNYRLISGVHDGQNAHDAVTVNQVNSVIDNLNSALNTNIPHIGATS